MSLSLVAGEMEWVVRRVVLALIGCRSMEMRLVFSGGRWRVALADLEAYRVGFQNRVLIWLKHWKLITAGTVRPVFPAGVPYPGVVD